MVKVVLIILAMLKCCYLLVADRPVRIQFGEDNRVERMHGLQDLL